MSRTHEIDFTKGKIFKPLLTFTIPLILSAMLQLFYNAADIVVVGRFAGKESLAAVGATGSLINLMVGAFLGLSVGVNVLISKGFGTGDKELLERAVHTAVSVSVIGGAIFGLLGVIFSKPILTLMGTPDDVIKKAVIYTRIYFIGLPATALYNFSSAVLRGVGDTKRPLYFLTISGFVNVFLNLFFVIVLKMDVAGVALATTISQCCSAGLVIACLIKTDAAYGLKLKKLKIHTRELKNILMVGLPAGVQGSLFSLSNVVIQSTINSFGSVAVAGNSAAVNIEGFVYTAMNAVNFTALTFSAQNLGVNNLKRIRKGVFCCMSFVTVLGIMLGWTVILFSNQIMGIYSADINVIGVGTNRLFSICSLYFLCGMMDVMAGSIRGLSYSVVPMVISLIGACGLRILWIYFIFPLNPSLFMLYLAYPISWALTVIALFIAYKFILRHLIKLRCVSV